MIIENSPQVVFNFVIKWCMAVLSPMTLTKEIGLPNCAVFIVPCFSLPQHRHQNGSVYFVKQNEIIQIVTDQEGMDCN